MVAGGELHLSVMWRPRRIREQGSEKISFRFSPSAICHQQSNLIFTDPDIYTNVQKMTFIDDVNVWIWRLLPADEAPVPRQLHNFRERCQESWRRMKLSHDQIQKLNTAPFCHHLCDRTLLKSTIKIVLNMKDSK